MDHFSWEKLLSANEHVWCTQPSLMRPPMQNPVKYHLSVMAYVCIVFYIQSSWLKPSSHVVAFAEHNYFVGILKNLAVNFLLKCISAICKQMMSLGHLAEQEENSLGPAMCFCVQTVQLSGNTSWVLKFGIAVGEVIGCTIFTVATTPRALVTHWCETAKTSLKLNTRISGQF